jgi:hypothetical protein
MLVADDRAITRMPIIQIVCRRLDGDVSRHFESDE